MGLLDTKSTYSNEYTNAFMVAKNVGMSPGAAQAHAETEVKRLQGIKEAGAWHAKTGPIE